jgi:hypothetical protein
VAGMRHFLLMIAVVVGMLSAFAAPASKPIQRTAKAPVVDGRLDDACWKSAAPVRAFYPHDALGKKTSPPPLIAKFSWDDHYLYLAYEVIDSSIVAIGTGKKEGPPKNRRPQSAEYLPENNLDLVEFFISFGSKQFFWEIHHNASNQLNNIWIELPTAAELKKIEHPSYNHITFHRKRFVEDDGKFTVKRAIHLKPKTDRNPSSVNYPSDIDTGFSGEIRLPWAGLGAPKPLRRKDGGYMMKGETLSILAVVLNGNDGKPKYHSTGSDLLPLMYHFSTSRWPFYRLEE